MKILSVIMLMMQCVNLFAQKNSFKNHVLIYQTTNTIDTVLVEGSKYCFIDEANKVHWSTEAFRTNDMGMGATIDTIRYNDTFRLQGNEAYIPHRISCTYKFSVRENQIWVSETLLNGKIKNEPYLDFNNKILNPDFDFFNGFDKQPEYYGKKAYYVKTKLLNKDTALKFNDKIIHCYKYEAYLNAITHHQYSIYLINKKTLLPIGFDIYSAVSSRSLENLKKQKTSYFLFGIMELNKNLEKKIHIWEDK